MSDDQKLKDTADDSHRLLDRRSMLQQSVGIALGLAAADRLTTTAEAQQAVLKVRRVVTGHNAQGKSVIVSDEMVNAADLWKTSGTEQLGPNGPGEPGKFMPTSRPELDPPQGGTWWRLVAMQPARDPKPSLANRVGFHRTATLDYAYVISGEVTLLVDVQETKLKPGDVVIQRNTDHAWRVDGPMPAQMLFTLVRVG